MPRFRAFAVLLAACALSTACGGGGSDGEPASLGTHVQPTRLYLAGDGQLTVVDVEANRPRVIALAELAPGDPPHRIVRRGDSLVFWGYDTYALDLDAALAPRRVGLSWFFIPSAVEDRVWLAILDPDSPETVRALEAVTEVTVDGHVTVPPVRPPNGRWPVASLTDGLLFEGSTGGLELWDPLQKAIVRRLPGASPGPTHGNLLAWCDDGGRLHLTDVSRDGGQARLAPPPGFAAFVCWAGAFAPDGRMLAVPVSARTDLAGQHALALVDVGSGAVEVVEGSPVPAGYVFVAWASSGEDVFLTGGGQRFEPRTIITYRLGEERARELAVEVPDFYGIAAS